MHNSVVIAGGGMRRLNGNKKYNKNFFSKRNSDAWDLHQNNAGGEGQRSKETGRTLVRTESGGDSRGLSTFFALLSDALNLPQ